MAAGLLLGAVAASCLAAGVRPEERARHLQARYRIPEDFNPLWRFGAVVTGSSSGASGRDFDRRDLDFSEGRKLEAVERNLDIDAPWNVEFELAGLMEDYLKRKRRSGAEADLDGLLAAVQRLMIAAMNRDLDALQGRIRRLQRLSDERRGLERQLVLTRARARRSGASATADAERRALAVALRRNREAQAQTRGVLPLARLTLPDLLARRDQLMEQLSTAMQRFHSKARTTWQLHGR